MLMRLLKPFRKWIKGKPVPARRPWRRRLYCEPLEDRCLMSVSLSGLSDGPVGAPVTWTATATGDGSSPVYQFSVQQPGSSAYQVVRDFSTSNSFTYNPMLEGSYNIKVNVEAGYGDPIIDTTSTPFTGDTRITGTSAVVNATGNPLVALYSAPPIPINNSSTSMYVQFSPDVSNPTWENTSPQAIVPGKSTNFLVAGMLPSTTYLMRDVLSDGTVSNSITFTTGKLPSNLIFPTFDVLQQPTPGTDPTDNMILHCGLDFAPSTVDLLATDLAGNIDWYYDPVANNYIAYGVTIVPGGTVLTVGGQLSGAGGTTLMAETDLLGDVLHETNISAVNAQLAAMGELPIINFSHDVLRLPNGYTAVIAGTQKTIDVNGTPTLYTADDVLVLDQNFQVKWVWDPFKYLDTSRLGTDGEGPNDWTHANAISWSPEDGNLLVSLRAQDWVLKIDYDHGAGDGHIIWKLGAGGNFTVNSTDPYPWFTHQHDARYINDNTIVVFDDGNTRVDSQGGGNSRGQEWVLNEKTMTATLVVNADLGNYSAALGSAQVLPNGNLDFTSGLLPRNTGQSIQVSPDGTQTYRLQMTGMIQYRSYFVNNLYDGAHFTYGLLDSGFENPGVGAGSQADPAETAWNFSGTAGVAGNGSTLTSGNPNAPQGNQVAYLQQDGSISQMVNILVGGTYQLSLLAAQLSSNAHNEEIQVQLDGKTVATFTPNSTSYAAYTTPSFQVTAGSHTISLLGVDPNGSGDTALIDQVSPTNIPTAGTATFLTTDSQTRGNWEGNYGSQGYSIINSASYYPSYAHPSTSGNSSWVWTNTSSDTRALQEFGSSNRIAGAWYATNSFTVNLDLTDGQTHQLALYLLDWDQWQGGRIEKVQILDATTGTVLDTQTASNFTNGEYLIWNVSGDIQIQITNLNTASSSNAVLNGLFLDPAGTPPPPPSPGTATFLKTDMATQGNWQGTYGTQGYNVIDNSVSYPSYAQVSASGNANYMWTNSTSDPRALEEVNSSSRIAAVWYANNSFTVNIDLTDGKTHQLALYLLDWDQWGGGRNEKIQLFSATDLSTALDTETVSNFANGEYLVWNVSGDIQIKITNLNSASNAVLNGLFIDPASTPPPPPSPGTATFLKTDITTQGNWQNAYGTQGYNVIDDAVNYNGYARVSASGNSNWVWTNSTSDPRALEEVPNSTSSSRIVAAWYANNSFTVNVDINDGKTHQLALYLLDWDQWGGGRNEKIEIFDATSGTLLDTELASNFSNGEYLVWNVSGDIQIKFTNLNSASNALLNGLFIDPAGVSPPPGGSASFLKTDTTTQGNWSNAYGKDGYNVIDDTVNYPSYAQVSANGNANYMWTNTTSDPRALQETDSPNRIAAVWYANNSFTVNVNMTGTTEHQLALYLLDWDQWQGGRNEQIQIFDATTGAQLGATQTASNFVNGEYLVWNVSGNIQIKVTNLNSASNAVLNGLFFG